MTHGSLFSGIGGFDLAAQWMGWTNVFHCEWNPFGQKILHHYWPNAIQYHDITKTDFSVHRGTIDVLTGGFPCQPYSMAGKRLGKEDERHLWPEMLRAIREIQPRWVVGENVLGLVNWSGGLVFHEVQADLETEGYEVQSFVLPAAAVNAPHRRDRIWFVAHSRKFRLELCTASRTMGERQEETCGERRESTLQSTPTGTARDAANTDRDGLIGSDRKHEEQSGQGRVDAFSNLMQSVNNGFASDTEQPRLQGQHRQWQGCAEHRSHKGIFIGAENKFYKSSWHTFPTVSPICHGDDGLSDRLDGITFSRWRQESIKGGGNAVVPQVVLRIFKTIEEYENQWTPPSQSDCFTSSLPD